MVYYITLFHPHIADDLAVADFIVCNATADARRIVVVIFMDDLARVRVAGQDDGVDGGVHD